MFSLAQESKASSSLETVGGYRSMGRQLESSAMGFLLPLKLLIALDSQSEQLEYITEKEGPENTSSPMQRQKQYVNTKEDN